LWVVKYKISAARISKLDAREPGIILSETFKFVADILMLQYKYLMNGIRQIKYPQEKYRFKVVD